MIQVRKQVPINASPDQVWAILGDLSRAPEYVPGVVSARVNGLNRICIDTSGNEIHETMSDYSAELRRYSFRHTQSPLPVKNSQGSFRVKVEGETAIAEMLWELDPLDVAVEAQIGPMIEGAAQLTLENLRQRVESAR